MHLGTVGRSNRVREADEWKYRGRERRLDSLLLPSEPDWRFSRIRLSSWWFTSERIDATAPGLVQERTAPARQRKHWASADDRALGPDRAASDAYAEGCANASGARNPDTERSCDSCA